MYTYFDSLSPHIHLHNINFSLHNISCMLCNKYAYALVFFFGVSQPVYSVIK